MQAQAPVQTGEAPARTQCDACIGRGPRTLDRETTGLIAAHGIHPVWRGDLLGDKNLLTAARLTAVRAIIAAGSNPKPVTPRLTNLRNRCRAAAGIAARSVSRCASRSLRSA